MRSSGPPPANNRQKNRPSVCSPRGTKSCQQAHKPGSGFYPSWASNDTRPSAWQDPEQTTQLSPDPGPTEAEEMSVAKLCDYGQRRRVTNMYPLNSESVITVEITRQQQLPQEKPILLTTDATRGQCRHHTGTASCEQLTACFHVWRGPRILTEMCKQTHARSVQGAPLPGHTAVRDRPFHSLKSLIIYFSFLASHSNSLRKTQVLRNPYTYPACTRTYHTQEYHLLLSLFLSFLTLMETSPNLKAKKWLLV